MNLTFASGLMRHWIGGRISGQQRPLLAGIKLTHRCNLQCRTCPFWRRPRPDLPFAAVETALRALYQAGCRLLILEGGEPLLWRDGELGLDAVIAAARDLGFGRIGITTNGTLPIETTADIVWVSLDGLKTAHEANRGPVWDEVMANIAACAHPKLFAQVTISRLNCREIPELVRFLADKVTGITVQFFYPYPESEDLWLPWPQRREVLTQLQQLKREGYPVLDSFHVLRDLADNRWSCHDWLIANAEPDPEDPTGVLINQGCYLKGRAVADCRRCGFAAHAELSLAYDLCPGPIWTGQQVFRFV